MKKVSKASHRKLEAAWKRRAELYAEARILRAEGDRLWAQAILAEHGNVKIEWKNWNSAKRSYECHLETGEVFKP